MTKTWDALKTIGHKRLQHHVVVSRSRQARKVCSLVDNVATEPTSSAHNKAECQAKSGHQQEEGKEDGLSGPAESWHSSRERTFWNAANAECIKTPYSEHFMVSVWAVRDV